MKMNTGEEEPLHLSPLKLLYSAYSSERPIYSPAMENALEQIDQVLSSLPQKEKHMVLGTVQKVWQENERLAFHAGIRTGVRLMEELAEL